MVKEVELSNEVEILAAEESYSNDAGQPLFEGYLEDDGMTLKIITHTPLKEESVSKRKLFLFFGNVDFNTKSVEYLKIDETGFDFLQDGKDATDNIYSLSVGKVLMIPRRVYNTYPSSDLTIQLYTYEANITTDYGSKVLSSPYSIEADIKYDYEKSTDGIFKLMTMDFQTWVSSITYDIGDIVVLEDALLVSTISDNNNNVIADETTEDTPYGEGWSVANESDIQYFSTGVTTNPPKRSFTTNIMISRYAKYNKIKNALLSTSFKKHDDTQAFELTSLLQRLREKAKYKLLEHKVIDAAYELYRLNLASTKQKNTSEVNTYNIKYTL